LKNFLKISIIFDNKIKFLLDFSVNFEKFFCKKHVYFREILNYFIQNIFHC